MVVMVHLIYFQQLLAAAKVSGRRAARRMMQEFPEAFDHDDAAPHIKVWCATYYVHSDRHQFLFHLHLAEARHVLPLSAYVLGKLTPLIFHLCQMENFCY